MADDFGGDVEFPAVATTPGAVNNVAGQSNRPRPSEPPAAQRPPKIVQPKPQQLVSRAGPSAILVSTRQKGNPVLEHIKSHPWEWSDIPADFVVGATTCVLFLSIKYHKLHPEYIYNRIRGLQGRYLLRIILTLVDVQDHEETLKELSKTSVINNVTVMLSWGPEQAARYLELFKQYEHGGTTAIQGHRSESYAEKMVSFITVPRGINKTDAASLVANFGSIRTAITAEKEQVAMVPGWGAIKVNRWCNTVREPFRIRKAAKRGLNRGDARAALSRDVSQAESEPDTFESRGGPPNQTADKPVLSSSTRELPDAKKRPHKRPAEEVLDPIVDVDEDGVQGSHSAGHTLRNVRPQHESPSMPTSRQSTKKQHDEQLSDGVAAALAKLRDQG